MKVRVLCAIPHHEDFHVDQEKVKQAVNRELSKLGYRKDTVKLHQQIVPVAGQPHEVVTVVVAILEH